MTIRQATRDDAATLERLWRAFEGEVPPPPHGDHDPEQELEEIREIVDAGLAFVAEDETGAVGFALARRTGERTSRLTDLYVAPDARRDGVAAGLVHAVVEALAPQGVEHLDLEVTASNAGARAVYHRWGFGEETVVLVAAVSALRERLAPGRHAESFASLHVQTDSIGDVERAARAFAPRIGSSGTKVVGPRNGWVTVYDEVIDRDPTALVRFAREVSSRMGTVVVALSLEVDEVVRMVALERGGIVDEYLSVPGVLRRPRARGRDRDGREPDGPRPADGRRPAAGANRRADRRFARRPAARAGDPRGARGRPRARGRAARPRGRRRVASVAC